MALRVALKNTIATLVFMEVAVNSLWIAQLLSSIVYRRPLTWVLFLARVVLTALELKSATLLLDERNAGPALVRAVLLASAALLTLEVGFRLAPTNLDPTFRWWLVGAYWAYALVIRWVLRRSAL